MPLFPANKILVVEDEQAISNLLVKFLANKGYEVIAASDGRSCLKLFNSFVPDLIILDLNLPDVSGFQLCQQLQNSSDVCILILSGLDDTRDKIKGFRQGADDYLTKPFDLEELAYRVEAILRRANKNPQLPSDQCLIFPQLTVDPSMREVTINEEKVHFTSLEFDILYLLASGPNQTWSRLELLNKIWGTEYTGDMRLVDVHVGQIRRKIQSRSTEAPMIETVRGIGYRFRTN
ncbi:MAG: response regulator transcription factor [Synechococcaceae cyanobacterium RL_1_2]|nr:response regulator transcription factor [Synechococcaceae cyanobacterium RL_1_2]